MKFPTISSFGSIFTEFKSLAARSIKYFKVNLFTNLIVVANLLCFFFWVPWLLDAESPRWHILGYQFSHADFGHLSVNMFFLILVGTNCEAAFGRLTTLLVYLLGGCFSAMGFLYFYPEAAMLGASGAVSSLMMLFPFTFETFISRFLGFIFVSIYFAGQFDAAVMDLASSKPASVAYLAHFLGAIWGLTMAAFLKKDKT